jgi:hypothetical protein
VILGLRNVKDHHKEVTIAYRRTTSRRVGYRKIGEAFGMQTGAVAVIVRRVYAKALKRHLVLEKERAREGNFIEVKKWTG